jgi:hypothetical protein
VLAVASAFAQAEDKPWDKDPVVQEVLAQRNRDIAALTAGGTGVGAEGYSTTFVANTPSNGVVTGEQMRSLFAAGNVSYDSIEQSIEYAAPHGPDLVVIMGEEVVVPSAGLQNAGKRVHRRFTDVFRKENGAWRHDIRHANVIKVE